MKRKVEEDIILEDKAILKEALKERGMTQRALAEKMGMKQNALSMNMTRDRMGLDNFKQVLDALGYAVAVIDKKDGNVRWVVDTDR